MGVGQRGAGKGGGLRVLLRWRPPLSAVVLCSSNLTSFVMLRKEVGWMGRVCLRREWSCCLCGEWWMGDEGIGVG